MTKNKIFLFALALLTLACKDQNKKEALTIEPINWNNRLVNYSLNDTTLIYGTTYLPIYSQIYSKTELRTLDLTVTVSMRNTNRNDTIFIEKAEYFNTKGEIVRSYFDKAIYIAPMETIEIIIKEFDQDGGTGANFLFDWKIRPNVNEPFFEGVMISVYGQGLSFTTQGVKAN